MYHLTRRISNEQRKVKDLIFAAQCVISEYNDTGDSNLLDDADEILCQALKELED